MQSIEQRLAKYNVSRVMIEKITTQRQSIEELKFMNRKLGRREIVQKYRHDILSNENQVLGNELGLLKKQQFIADSSAVTLKWEVKKLTIENESLKGAVSMVSERSNKESKLLLEKIKNCRDKNSLLKKRLEAVDEKPIFCLEHEEKIETLESQVKKKDGVISSLTKKTSRFEEIKKELAETKRNQLSESSDFEEKIQTLESQVTKKDGVISSLTKKTTRFEEMKKELTATKKQQLSESFDYEQKIQILESQLTKKNGVINLLTEKVTGFEGMEKELADTKKQLSESVKEAQIALENCKTTLELEVKDINDQHEQALASMEKDRREQSSEIIENKQQDLEEKMKIYLQEKDLVYEEKISKLSMYNESVKEELREVASKLEAESKALEDERRKYVESKERNTRLYNDSKEKLREQRDKIKAYQKKMQALSKDLQAAREELKKSASANKNQSKEQNDQVEALMKKYAALEKLSEESKAHGIAENEGLSQEVDKISGEKKTLEKENADLKTELEGAEKKFLSEKNSLNLTLMKKKSLLEIITIEKRNLEQTMKELNLQLETLKSDLAVEKSRHEEAKIKIEKLQKELLEGEEQKVEVKTEVKPLDEASKCDSVSEKYSEKYESDFSQKSEPSKYISRSIENSASAITKSDEKQSKRSSVKSISRSSRKASGRSATSRRCTSRGDVKSDCDSVKSKGSDFEKSDIESDREDDVVEKQKSEKAVNLERDFSEISDEVVEEVIEECEDIASDEEDMGMIIELKSSNFVCAVDEFIESEKTLESDRKDNVATYVPSIDSKTSGDSQDDVKSGESQGSIVSSGSDAEITRIEMATSFLHLEKLDTIIKSDKSKGSIRSDKSKDSIRSGAPQDDISGSGALGVLPKMGMATSFLHLEKNRLPKIEQSLLSSNKKKPVEGIATSLPKKKKAGKKTKQAAKANKASKKAITADSVFNGQLSEEESDFADLDVNDILGAL